VSVRCPSTLISKSEDEPKVLKAVKLSEEKYCGVSKMFQAFAKVSFKINYL
jgi:uncharacterized OsmC-like protein